VSLRQETLVDEEWLSQEWVVCECRESRCDEWGGVGKQGEGEGAGVCVGAGSPNYW